MEPPPLHPKYQTPPKRGRAPSSAAGAAPASAGLRREAADASSSSSALARSAAGGWLSRSVAKGCPDPLLLPAGIPSSGNHAWARAVVVQRGCAWGKDFTSCPRFPGQQNRLRSQPQGLGRFVKASVFPTHQAVARQRTCLFGTRVVPTAEGFSARAVSLGMDLCLAGTPTLSILSPGPGAASRYFHTWLQQSCGAGAPRGAGAEHPTPAGLEGAVCGAGRGQCHPVPASTAHTVAARGRQHRASPVEELPLHKGAQTPVGETPFTQPQRAPGTPAKHIWLKAVGAAPALRTPVRKHFPPREIPPSQLCSQHHSHPICGCQTMGSAKGWCPGLPQATGLSGRSGAGSSAPTSEGTRGCPAPGQMEGGMRVLLAQGGVVARGWAHRQLCGRSRVAAACSKAAGEPWAGCEWMPGCPHTGEVNWFKPSSSAPVSHSWEFSSRQDTSKAPAAPAPTEETVLENGNGWKSPFYALQPQLRQRAAPGAGDGAGRGVWVVQSPLGWPSAWCGQGGTATARGLALCTGVHSIAPTSTHGRCPL